MHKNTPAQCLLALAMFTTWGKASASDPASVKVGGFDITPLLSLEQIYDTNIFSQPDGEQESWVTVLTPEVQATADFGTVELLALYQHETGLYESSRDDNYHDNQLDIEGIWELNYRNQFELEGSYKDGHEDRGTGYSQGEAANAIDEPDTFDEYLGGLSYLYGGERSRVRLKLNVTGFEKNYTNHRDRTEGRDREGLRGNALLYWRVGGRTDLVAEVRQNNMNYVNDPAEVAGQFDTLDSVSNQYLVGVTWEATGKTEGSIKVGHATKAFKDDDREDFSGASWEIGMQWSPKTYSVLSFKTVREDRETNGNGSFIDSQVYDVDWTHDWSERVTSILFYRYQDDVYEGDVLGRQDETARYGFRIDYSFRRWLDVGVSLTEIGKDSTINQFDYDREKIALHFSLSL